MNKIIRMLSEHTGLEERLVQKIMSSAPNRYKVYDIPKRSGGHRTIAQPAREVKVLQRALVDVVLKRLPVHEAATAYMSGSSIVGNARRHAGAGAVLKMDFKDFFPSIKHRDWIDYCNDNELFSSFDDVYLTCKLMFWQKPGTSDLRLAIGAPSSPILSNILMFEFDKLISAAIIDDRVTYTRYADDLTFSAPRTGFLRDVMKNVNGTIRRIRYPRLIINHAKTTYITRKYRQVVTGLTLSLDGRVTIGREKKREIRAAINNIICNKTHESDLSRLNGYLSFVNDVEPDFINKLKDRYGEEIFHQIKRRSKYGVKPLTP